MTDRIDPVEETAVGDDGSIEPGMVEAPRVVERDDVERRLRRDVARLREQVRSAQADRENALANLRAEQLDQLVRSELRVEALRAGIVDLDALRLVDTSGLAMGSDGMVEGAAASIAALKEQKPYLFTAIDAWPSARAATSTGGRAPQPASLEKIDARTLTREQWHIERERLIRRARR